MERPDSSRRNGTPAQRNGPQPDVPRRPLVVVHPETVDLTALRELVAAAFDEAGWPCATWSHTSTDDPGTGITRDALSEGADLVVCCGGDGTIRAVATALAGTSVPLVVVPTGTGNLLARNLGIPTELEVALRVATAGRDRRIDLGRAGTGCFAAMAGIGLDAAMVRDARPRLKKALGWPAYVLSAAQHLRDPAMAVRLRVDGGPVRNRRAVALVVGNVGSLQGGRPLLPDADPSDGELDLAVIAPRSVREWLTVAARVARGASSDDLPLERLTFRRLEIAVGAAQPCELDGDFAGETSSLVVEVCPQALTVRVPA